MKDPAAEGLINVLPHSGPLFAETPILDATDQYGAIMMRLGFRGIFSSGLVIHKCLLFRRWDLDVSSDPTQRACRRVGLGFRNSEKYSVAVCVSKNRSLDVVSLLGLLVPNCASVVSYIKSFQFQYWRTRLYNWGTDRFRCLQNLGTEQHEPFAVGLASGLGCWRGLTKRKTKRSRT